MGKLIIMMVAMGLTACGDNDGDVPNNGPPTTQNHQTANQTGGTDPNNQATTANQTTTNNQTQTNSGTNGETTGEAGCGSSHPRVGQTLTLNTRAHGVAGSATVVDDCTIDVNGFSFDGGGVDVRFYGGLDGDYAGGFAMTENLVGTAFNNQSLTITLPAAKTLDDLDGLSVWCYDFTVSFGDGLFQ